jgi:hypothetical protein
VAAALLVACPHGTHLPPTAPRIDLPTDFDALLRLADASFREPMHAEVALAAASAAARAKPDDLGALWRAARAAFELADMETDASRALRFAKDGAGYGERAVTRGANCGECHYYLALCLGIVARGSATGNALTLVKRVAALAKRAHDLAPALDDGGAERLLGILLARVPPWPTSIGDLDLALQHLRSAVTRFPDQPLNRLFLAEALVLDKRYDDARAQLRHVLGAPKQGAWARVGARWRREAKKLLRRIVVRERDDE